MSDSQYDSEQDRKQSYLDSLASEDFEAYETALGVDPSLDLLGRGPIAIGGTDGCTAEAYSSTEPPPWINYSHWLNEVSIELSQRSQADQRLKIFDQQWSECMSELGFDNWSSPEDLVDSLNTDFIELLDHLSAEHTKSALLTGFDLAALDGDSATAFDNFTEKEIELAIPNYDCTVEFWDSRNRIYEELERAILASNLPTINGP